jgi:hypothetical protein
MPKLDESKLAAYVAGLPVEHWPHNAREYLVWSELYCASGWGCSDVECREAVVGEIKDKFLQKLHYLELAKAEVEKFADLLEEVPIEQK